MISLRARLLPLLALLPMLAAAQQTGTPPTTASNEPALTKEMKEEILSAIEDVVVNRAFVPGVELSKWTEFIAKQREAIDAAEKDSDFTRAVNAALRDFGISHIRFLAPRAAQARVRTTAVGVGLNGRASQEGLTVTMVFPKSPAELAGLKQGEVIVEVDGRVPDSSAVLMGEEGTEVSLKVKGADGSVREVKVKRATYSTVRPDSVTWVDEESAVLKIHSFSRGYNRREIDKLVEQASKAKYLVLDLRSNGGGATNNLQHLLSLLMPEDTVIGTFVSRTTARQFAEKHGKEESDPIALAADAANRYRTRKQTIEPFKGKIAVLVNRGSASASEICAAALRENLGAPIVGTRTAGAVLASIFRRLPHGYEMQFPIMDYVTAKGVRLEKNPIVPDIEVTERPEDGKDPAVEKALERLRQ